MRVLIGREIEEFTGIETRYYHDAAEKKIYIQRLQDVEPTLEANQAEYNSHGDHARFAKGELHKMATIPPAIIEQWHKEGFNVFTASDADLRKRLNDPEWRKLRTKPGRL